MHTDIPYKHLSLKLAKNQFYEKIFQKTNFCVVISIASNDFIFSSCKTLYLTVDDTYQCLHYDFFSFIFPVNASCDEIHTLLK